VLFWYFSVFFSSSVLKTQQFQPFFKRSLHKNKHYSQKEENNSKTTTKSDKVKIIVLLSLTCMQDTLVMSNWNTGKLCKMYEKKERKKKKERRSKKKKKKSKS